MLYEWLYQYISCGLIFHAFHALEVEFFQLNLFHLRPGSHYTPVDCHGMPKISNGGFAYTQEGKLKNYAVYKIDQLNSCARDEAQAIECLLKSENR